LIILLFRGVGVEIISFRKLYNPIEKFPAAVITVSEKDIFHKDLNNVDNYSFIFKENFVLSDT